MPAHLPGPPSTRQSGFSPFRRHRTARALAAYVLAECRDGRLLPEVLEDRVVRECAAEHPEVLEDVAWDQEILAAIEDRRPVHHLASAPEPADARLVPLG